MRRARRRAAAVDCARRRRAVVASSLQWTSGDTLHILIGDSLRILAEEDAVRVTLTVMPDSSDPSGLDTVLAAIKSAVDVGFSRVWLPQLPPMAGQSGWDALTALALAGARTPHVELGTGVAVAYGQHPFALARQALTASAATDGRLVLGIGVSHKWVVS